MCLTTMPSQSKKWRNIDSASSLDLEPGKPSCFKPALDSDLSSDSRAREDANSEGEYLWQRIVYHKDQGRVKSKWKPWSISLVKREFQEWKKFVCI